jgi:hypothetical protein
VLPGEIGIHFAIRLSLMASGEQGFCHFQNSVPANLSGMSEISQTLASNSPLRHQSIGVSLVHIERGNVAGERLRHTHLTFLGLNLMSRFQNEKRLSAPANLMVGLRYRSSRFNVKLTCRVWKLPLTRRDDLPVADSQSPDESQFWFTSMGVAR